MCSIRESVFKSEPSHLARWPKPSGVFSYLTALNGVLEMVRANLPVVSCRIARASSCRRLALRSAMVRHAARVRSRRQCAMCATAASVAASWLSRAAKLVDACRAQALKLLRRSRCRDASIACAALYCENCCNLIFARLYIHIYLSQDAINPCIPPISVYQHG